MTPYERAEAEWNFHEILCGWWFATRTERRKMCETARKEVANLPPDLQGWAEDEIAAIEAHC